MKPVTLTWLPDAEGGILKLEMSAPTLTATDRDEIERLAIRHGFLVNGSTWTAPDQSVAISDFRLAAKNAGYIVHLV